MNYERISSRQNPLVKWVVSLQDKKGRDKEKCFLADGFKLLEEAVQSGAEITYILICEEKFDRYITAVKTMIASIPGRKPRIVLLSESCFEKISSEKAPQGIVSVIKHLDKNKNIIKIYKEEVCLEDSDRAVFLASVRDPSNLGAILRSASAFGVSHVIMTDDCADLYNPKVVRSAMGALFRVTVWTVRDAIASIRALREDGRRVVAAELRDGAVSLLDAKIVANDIVVIGNEGHGIPQSISDACDCSVYIPIASHTESLNASVAASILLWEQGKQ